MTNTTTKNKKKDRKDRPPTPVFFENYAPPKKAKKGLGSKKRFASNPRDKPVNLLLSILHNHEKKEPKKPKDKIKDKSKKTTSKSGKPVGKLQ